MTAEYESWVRKVKSDGGRVVLSAIGTVNGRPIPSRLSAAYDFTVWGPKSNAKLWPLPNEYSVNGKSGYYHAPLPLQTEMAAIQRATEKETAAGATSLMNKWGVPTMFRGLGNYVTALVMIGVVLGGVYIVANRKRNAN